MSGMQRPAGEKSLRERLLSHLTKISRSLLPKVLRTNASDVHALQSLTDLPPLVDLYIDQLPTIGSDSR